MRAPALDADTRVTQHIGDGRATCWGPYEWVTDPLQADSHTQCLREDLSQDSSGPMMGVHVECDFDQVCVVQLSSDRRGLVRTSRRRIRTL